MSQIDLSQEYCCPHHVLAPTPEEIEQRCVEIQATWSWRDRIKRRGCSIKAIRRPEDSPLCWSPPLIDLAALQFDATD